MAGPEIQFLQDLAVLTGVAAGTSIILQKVRFPVVFGLLTAGVIVGPHTPPFDLIQNEQSLQVLANLGIVLLLFGLGLEFNLRGLRRNGIAAAVITAAEVLLMFWIGFEAGRLLGWSPLDAAFLGAMLSISSTAIIVAVLREMGKMDAESSRLLFAVLVLEDVAAILILVLLSGYSATGDLPLRDAMIVLGRMALFLLAFIALGLLVVPRFLDWVARTQRPQVLILSILAIGLAGAVLSDLAAFHVGLGAFITGALCAEAKRKHLLEENFRPIHDLFAAIFFVSIGTLVDFELLAAHWPSVFVVTVFIIAGKTLSGGLAAFFAGYAPRVALTVGVALAQIGEFSFVIASLGLTTNTMDPALFPVIVGAAAVTSLASPLLIRASEPIANSASQLMPMALKTYSSVYTSFLRTWRERPRGQQPEIVVKERRNAVASALLLVLAWGGAFALHDRGIRVARERGLDLAPSELIYWALWLVLIVPSLVEFNRHVGRWIEASHRARGAHAEGLGVRAVVRTTLFLGVGLLVGLPVLAATRPLLSGGATALLWLGFIAVLSIALLRSIRRLHHRVSDNLTRLLQEENPTLSVSQVLETLVSREFPADFQIETVTLHRTSAWAERRISDVQLRPTTGASIILVERTDGRQLVPGPDTLLLPEDRLTLLGSPDQVDAARGVLAQEQPLGGDHQPLHPGRLFVPPRSPLEGRLLAETDLRKKFGLHVVAIQRGADVMANPEPHERIQGDDVLIVLGTREQIIAASEASHLVVSQNAPS